MMKTYMDSPLCQRILHQRGFDTPELIAEQLETSLDTVLKRPVLLDITAAVQLLMEAKESGSAITVYHDYDADGIMACAVVKECLQKLGLSVYSYANTRARGGYGMQRSGVDEILSMHPRTRIILTVDNGITASEAIEYAKQQGLKVIVTDHHEPGAQLPAADAIIDPKRSDETCVYRDYCGAGVAFLLMLALYRKAGFSEETVLGTLDMVALATVADVVPLLCDNRAIVKEGLRRINNKTRPIFRFLAETRKEKVVTAHSTIGYQYAPMINAPARMGQAVDYIVDAFLTHDEKMVASSVERMRVCNEERKDDTAYQTDIALSKVFDLLKENALPPVIVLYSSHFDEGVIGLIAGRITNRFHRPSIVFADGAEEGVLKASCRSIDAFPIHAMLNRLDAEEIMLSHGGHTMAAGLSIRKDCYGQFCHKITELGWQELTPDDFRPRQPVDLIVRPDELTVNDIRAISELEPFGEGFRQPLFELVGYGVGKAIRFGNERQHLKVILENITLLFWNEAGSAVQAMARKSCVGVPSINEWQGTVSVDFTVDDSFYGVSNTMLQCKNGELVEVIGMENNTVCIDYKGKIYTRTNDAFANTLMPFDPITSGAGYTDLRCETCLHCLQGSCSGRSIGICEFFQNCKPVSDESCRQNTFNNQTGYYRVKRASLAEKRGASSKNNAQAKNTASCEKCILFKREDCFGGKPNVCQDYRPAPSIEQCERDNWPKYGSVLYGRIKNEKDYKDNIEGKIGLDEY